MQFSKVVAFAFLVGSSLVLGSTVPEKRVFTNNGVTFRGEVNGHAFEETGTVQEVWATLKARHPEFELDATAVAERKEKRDKVLPPLCIPVAGQDWNFAEAAAIDDGINYLKGLKSTLSIAGNTCSRISCSYNSAIHWCNDNNGEVSADSGYLASFAQDLQDHCQHCISSGHSFFCVVGGQEFEDDEHYNVIVRDASC
ncbi:uncharacterized protein K444DRAFT_626073 [Hyaloscypha bicolor E]|uniref:SCP domain-containing protein n=1 Tax=Hyaloscypha bicolor E TaxID=1095630 RepID=A0A2J6TME9_9HELO|nr:uncharacterized protein K444DRAFT_626073 [Hyaloscypha bicolor E]PMD64196.1 hypothetical protein K444DRAFT_626073 [Hyaloscypha bicolor E]